MRYLFPYHMVKQGSRIILYGCGECGKDFWLQIQFSNYCKLVAWVDRGFDDYEIRPPFAQIKEITNFLFDYVVIAISDKHLSDEVRVYLKSLKVDESKIVWSNAYTAGSNLFPINKHLFLKDFGYYSSLIEDVVTSDNFFAGGRYYQGYKELGLIGSRNNEERIVLYGIPKRLNTDMSVLDMGCNYGFFDLLVAPYVRNIIGVDIEPYFTRIAIRTAEYLQISNAKFVCTDAFIMLRNDSRNYDAIFNLGVYGYILKSGVSEEEFVETISSRLNIGGKLFFESHPLDSLDKVESYRRICHLFENKMTIIAKYNYESIGEREMRIFQLN